MTRAEKVAEARRLRGQGLTYQEIADRLGVSQSTPVKWCNPERAKRWARESNNRPGRTQQKLAWAKAHRPRCPECGGEMGTNALRPSRTSHHCRDCELTRRRVRRSERGHRIEHLWAEGLSLNEIAARLDWTRGSLGREMNWLRANGFHLPYRYAAWERKKAA